MQHIQSKSNNTSHEEQICMSEAKCIFVMSDLVVMHERSEMHDMNNLITNATYSIHDQLIHKYAAGKLQASNKITYSHICSQASCFTNMLVRDLC